MNSTLGAHSQRNATSASSAPSAALPLRPIRPMLWCALVVLLALMSSFVYVLNGQVERAERLRASFGSFGPVAKPAHGAKGKALALPAQQWAEAAPSRALVLVGLDTAR